MWGVYYVNELLLAMLAALFVTLLAGPVFIPLLRKLKVGQVMREDGPHATSNKAGTPSMGGIIFLIGIIAGTLIFLKGSAKYTIVSLVVMLAYGIVGFLDDYIKVKLKRNLGLKAYQKLIGQVGIALAIAIYAQMNIGTEIFIPFANIDFDMGVFYIPFTMLVVIAVVNSVNLTDGLDGLAAGTSMIVFVTIGLIIGDISKYFSNTFMADEYGNLAVMACAASGACLGFLAFNFKPAKVFMGDTGSLALGGLIASLFIMTKMSLLLPIMGGMFMVSSISDIIQVVSYKTRKKRVFRMAPLHHHFELGGMPETKIVIMYYILTAVLCAVGALLV